MSIDPGVLRQATRAMCRVLYGDDFDLHDHGAQDPDSRDELERAAEAAIVAAQRPRLGDPICAWCPELARATALHNDGHRHTSCGEHGREYTPEEPK